MPEATLDGTQVNRSVVRVIRGDITDLEVDAFVYYAQPDLVLGSGFGGAIAMRGGPSVQKELDELGPLAPGEAIIAGAGNLKAEHIIHAVGPRFQEEHIEEKLRATVVNALKCADANGVKRLAFPSMGAGYYGIPPAVSANVMANVLQSYLASETGLTEVVICVLDTPQHDAFQAAIAALD